MHCRAHFYLSIHKPELKRTSMVVLYPGYQAWAASMRLTTLTSQVQQLGFTPFVVYKLGHNIDFT